MSTRLRTISSTNSGLPPARATMRSRSRAKASLPQGTEQAVDELPGLVGGERGEADLRLLGAGHDRRADLRPMRHQQHQAPVGQLIGEVAQQIDRGCVRPMEIVDDDQERPLLEATLDQQAGGEHDLALELLGIEVARTRLLDAKQVAQHRRDRLG